MQGKITSKATGKHEGDLRKRLNEQRLKMAVYYHFLQETDFFMIKI